MDAPRVSINLRIDRDKYDHLESQRRTGFGFAVTDRNRSDVYNEILGYGIQTAMLRAELGERDFEKLWQLIHKINWNKLQIDNVEKMFAPLAAASKR
jgi:hypothetical protein